MSRSGYELKGTPISPRFLIFFSNLRPANVSLSSLIVCMRLYMTLTCVFICIQLNIISLPTNNNCCSPSSRVDSHIGQKHKWWNKHEASDLYNLIDSFFNYTNLDKLIFTRFFYHHWFSSYIYLFYFNFISFKHLPVSKCNDTMVYYWTYIFHINRFYYYFILT